MISVTYHCNLDDVMRLEKFPKELAARPMVGDYIRSATKWGPVQLCLKVVNVTFNERGELCIELHLHNQWKNISDFHNWYDLIRGKISHEIYQLREGRPY